MMHGRFRILGPAIVGVGVLLTACGSSGGSSAETTVAEGTTLWRTLPPVANASDDSTVEQEGVISYTVRRGDYPGKIAKAAGGDCTGTELLEFNPEVNVDEDFVPGLVLKIPGACLGAGVTEESLNAGEDASTDDATDDSDSSDDESDTTEEPKFNSYTIVSGDFPFKIVEKTGCSYDELKKANGRKFTNPKPKVKLKIPVDCDTREADEDTDSSD